MTIRRPASLPLALSLLLVAGAASAAPVAAKRESAIVSFGKAIKVGVDEYKERRAAQGPGFVKRALSGTGAMMRTAGGAVGSMALGVKDRAVGMKDSVKVSAVSIGQRGVKGVIATRQAVVAAPGAGMSFMAKDWAQTKADFKAMGNAVKSGVTRMVVGTKAAVAKVIERRAAQKDFKAWLKEKGNEDVKTFYAGAIKEQHLGVTKTVRAAAVVSSVASGTVVAANPALGLALVGVNAHAFKSMNDQVKRDQSRAATRTFEFALNSSKAGIDDARVASWVKAGIMVDPTAPGTK